MSRRFRSRGTRPYVPFLAVLVLLAAACNEAADFPTALGPDGASAAVHPTPASASHFRAHLTGAAEVPPVTVLSQGQATFRLSEDGSALSYRLMVANLTDLHMAHIHMAPADQNGPVVAWLYPDGPPPQQIEGRFSGALATGVITAADLVGPLAGASMADLVAAMEAGGTYVNVHTFDHPGGAIRGQIE